MLRRPNLLSVNTKILMSIFLYLHRSKNIYVLKYYWAADVFVRFLCFEVIYNNCEGGRGGAGAENWKSL